MLGTDRAAKAMHTVVHQFIDRILLFQQLSLGIGIARGDVVVQVTIATMAADHIFDARKAFLQRGVGGFADIGTSGSGTRHIVLDALSESLPCPPNAPAPIPHHPTTPP